MIKSVFQLGRDIVNRTKENWPKWAMAVAVIIGLPAIFMTIDNACSPISNGFCRQWLNFQWETILAGMLGLAGGAFALTAVKYNVRREEEKAGFRYAMAAYLPAQALADRTHDAILRLRQLLENTPAPAEASGELISDWFLAIADIKIPAPNDNTPVELQTSYDLLCLIRDTIIESTRRSTNLVKYSDAIEHLQLLNTRANQLHAISVSYKQKLEPIFDKPKHL